MKSIEFISFRENARERPRHGPEPPRLSFLCSAVYVECHGRQPALEMHRFAHLGARQRMERGERSLLPAIPRPEAGKLANVVGLSNRGRSRFSRSLQRRSIEAGPNPLKSPLLRE